MEVYELTGEAEDSDEWMYTLLQRSSNVSVYDKGWTALMQVPLCYCSPAVHVPFPPPPPLQGMGCPPPPQRVPRVVSATARRRC